MCASGLSFLIIIQIFPKYFQSSFFLFVSYCTSSQTLLARSVCRMLVSYLPAILYIRAAKETCLGAAHALVFTDNWVLKSLGGFLERPQVWCLGLPVHIWNSNSKDFSPTRLPSFFWGDVLSPIGKISVNNFKDWHRLTAHCRGRGSVFSFPF